MKFGGNITSVVGKPFGATKDRARKRHSSLEWTVAVARHRMRKVTQEVRGETTGASPSRNRPEPAGERAAMRQAHLGELGNSTAVPDTAQFARPSGSV